MSKLTKNQKSVADKVEAGKAYTLKEASELVKEITTTKFDASLDIDVRLGVDPLINCIHQSLNRLNPLLNTVQSTESRT
jgi:ribosomal protein L1